MVDAEVTQAELWGRKTCSLSTPGENTDGTDNQRKAEIS